MAKADEKIEGGGRDDRRRLRRRVRGIAVRKIIL